MPGWIACSMLENYPQNRRQDEDADSNRQLHLPSYFHELIEAVAGERGPIPDVQIHKSSHLRDEPINILNAVSHWRHEQDQADQAKHRTKPSQANGLHPEVRMLRHTAHA